MHAFWCTSPGACPQASGMLHGDSPTMEHTHTYPHSVYVHCELPHQCTHINIEGHSHTWAQRHRCLQVCPHTSYHSMHGCPSQAQPQGGRLHDRGMQTSRDALPADVRERLRGNHVGRNPGRRARLRWGPRVLRIVQGVGHVQTLALVSPVTPCP